MVSFSWVEFVGTLEEGDACGEEDEDGSVSTRRLNCAASTSFNVDDTIEMSRSVINIFDFVNFSDKKSLNGFDVGSEVGSRAPDIRMLVIDCRRFTP